MDLIIIVQLIFTITALPVLSVNGDCTLGRTDLVETSPNPTPGLFIDIDNPAACSGQITAWNLCYYNPRLHSLEDNLQISLQIWRFDTPRNGVRVGAHVETVAIPETPENFQCIAVELSQDEYMNVSAGDFIGVLLNRDAVLPVVGNSIGSTLLFLQASLFVPTEVSRIDTVPLSSNALHITAEIVEDGVIPPATTGVGETIPQPTDQGQTTPLQPGETPPGPTTIDVGEPEKGGNVGVIAIVVVVLALVFLAMIAATVGFTLCVRRRKSGDRKCETFTIDNAVYDRPDIQPNSNGSLSYSSTYEVPLDTVRRPRLSSSYHKMDNSTDVYSTVDDRGFNDSFETEHGVPHYTNSEHGGEDSSGVFNPYSTLAAVNMDCSKSFFNEATSVLYANPDSTSETRETPFQEPPNDEENIYKELSRRTRTIDRMEIKIHNKIGEGAFSTVSKGSWVCMGLEYDIAVKSLIQNSSEIDKIKLLQEAAIMGQFQHPNIVKLFGVTKKGNLPMLVTEFLHKGDLLNALQTIHPDPGKLVESSIPQLLLSYSQQVALGMHYLASKGFVHRDLAARNIFVTRDNICKVGDFGMSRELADTDYYVSRGGVVPVRWTAPEAIFYRKYSTTSDVWSYGCLLYEIWTLGMRPYEGIATSKYLETLQVGYRLPPPPGCPKAKYRIMIECWHPTANERPGFSDILTRLLREKEEVLTIPEKDGSTHSQACLLGASVEAGLEMYKDLQNAYLAQPSSREKCYTKQQQSRTESEKENLEMEWNQNRNPYEMEEDEGVADP